MATDPFRGELTATYVRRERLEWASAERLARAARPSPSAPTLTKRVIALVARHFSRPIFRTPYDGWGVIIG